MTRRGGPWRQVVGAALVVAGMVGAIGLSAVWVAPYDEGARVDAQLRHLAGLDAQAALSMQQAFPEGEMFTHLLTGLAAGERASAATDDKARSAALDVVEHSLDAVQTDSVKGRFGTIEALDGGIFYRGWTLLLESYLVSVDDGSSRHERYLPRASADATAILQAVTESPSGFVASYPGQYWPCDTVVALAAVMRLRGNASGLFAWDPASWIVQVFAHRDPATGLLPHQVDATGSLLVGSRGSSQSIIATFWPSLTDDRADWSRFVDLFVAREAGLVGVREYPRGVTGSGDVDSGPLVLGISVSASAVGLAAARANGDAVLADTLDREAEMVGLPWQWNGARSYALGVLPVGDAFLAWARSVPLGVSSPAPAVRAVWPVWLLPWVTVAAIGGVVLRTGSPRPRRTSL